MIRHLVMLRFKKGVAEDTKKSLYSELAGLSDHIEGIVDFQTRPNISVEDELVRDFRDMFWFDFDSVSARDAYLVNETHQAIGGRIVAELEGAADGVFVCDIDI